jgi:hypothetical protein
MDNAHQQGAGMAVNRVKTWREILAESKAEADELGVTISDVLDAKLLEVDTQIMQTDADAREHQVFIVDAVMGAITQGLAMWRNRKR